MKRFFNHTGKSYKKWDEKEYIEEDYDWDDYQAEAEYEGEEAYYETEAGYEGDEAYYEAEAEYEDEEAYYEAEAEYEGEEAYYEAEAEYEGEEAYYEAEAEYEGEEVYYEAEAEYEGEDAYYEAEAEYEGEEVYYEAEAEYEDEDAYYEAAYEDEYYEEDEYAAIAYAAGSVRQKNKTSLWSKLTHMSAMDKIVAATGIGVLILALVTGGVYASARVVDKQVSQFVSVGSQLEDINLIGEEGLMAVADAQLARQAAAEIIEEEEKEKLPEYQETEYSNLATVVLDMVSIQKDLKIKFTNKETDKLIPNVPFSIAVTDPDGKTATWNDDDMDGIIYKKGITPGKYKISVNALTDIRYKDYILPIGTESVEVKKDIAYEKVDVKNEIKTEAQVNAAVEDTKKKETVVESALEDTVQWVESTVTANTYVEVAKSTVPDPLTLIAKNNFMRTSAVGTGSVSGGNAVTPTPAPTVNPITMSLDKTAVTTFLTAPATINASVGNATTNNAVTAESSDTAVATVSVSGKAVTVNGVSAGSATITVKYVENGVETKAVCTVTVKAHPKDDTTTKLLDSNGKQLYVLNGNEYREAVYADYYTASQFFLRGESKYTGWQTLDGKVYFFDASGKKVTGEQIIQGAKYNFASDGSMITDGGVMGIDVSKWNGSKIDWEAVKNSGVSYVIIRCGYRGSSQGALIEDPRYRQNIKGATAAGLKVGVYFFTQAVDEVEAVEEASMVLELVKDYKISYPIFLDVEPSGGRADGIDKGTRTAVCKAFCATIQDAGYTAGVYANKTWLSQKIDASALGNYKIWLAQYAVTPTYSGRYDLWQYTDKGRISGISGNVDLNISYLGY